MGESLSEEPEIEAEITNFYKKLYENYDNSNLAAEDNTFFDQITGVSALDDTEASKRFDLRALGKVLDSCSDSAPGPDGIRREIVNKSVKLGELGMLDVSELDVSLKIKALGRLMSSGHPFLRIIKERVVLSDFVYPTINTAVEEIAVRAVGLLARDRLDLLGTEALESKTAFVQAVKNVKIINALNRNGKLSLAWHFLRTRGRQLLGELNPIELDTIRRFINPDLARRIVSCDRINLAQVNNIGDCLLVKGLFKSIKVLTSKQIRESRTSKLPILIYKIGPILTLN